MKGLTAVKMVGAVAAVLLSAVIFASAKDIVDNIFKDKEYFEAKLTLLGIRDNMILASTLDRGEIKFKSFGTSGSGTYELKIDEEFISLRKLDKEGNEINMPPVAPLPHYTPEAILKAKTPPYVVKIPASKNVCIMKWQEPPECGPAVGVFEAAGDACTPAPISCK